MNRSYSILDFGAIPGGEIDCTDSIQAALNACAKDGGGRVEIPKRIFLTGDIRIRSNTELHLCSGAVLLGSPCSEDYNRFFRDPIEPVDPAEINLGRWERHTSEGNLRMVSQPMSRWHRGLIRAMNAENIAIVGEPDSFIDGNDVYDPLGEEYYRGPHAISLRGCKNVTLSGYTVRRSGNWAHNIHNSSDITVKGITVLGGHDGFDIFGCDRVSVEKCGFYTGDDCIAGFNNRYIHISDCDINSSCSAFRFAGTDVLVEGCRIRGPGKYIFRGSLTPDEKKNSAPSDMSDVGHRRNMLSFVTYYADREFPITRVPGNIVFRNCSVKNADRFIHYNFSGSEYWQSVMPLHDITFENIIAENVAIPLNLYGDDIMKVRLKLKDVAITFGTPQEEFIRAANYRRIVLDNVSVEPRVIKCYKNGGEVISDSEFTVVNTDEKFAVRGI